MKKIDGTLFPKGELWGTGDEAWDLGLTKALSEALEDLSYASILKFYRTGQMVRPRTSALEWKFTLEHVVKALLFVLDPLKANDQELIKFRGGHFLRNKVHAFAGHELSLPLLKDRGLYRYQGQLDFYLKAQEAKEFNPYLLSPMKRSPYLLEAKIIFKQFKQLLVEQDCQKLDHPFFKMLADPQGIVRTQFADIWFDGELIHCALRA